MKYLRLLFPILIFAIGIQFLLDHFVRNPANLAKYEKLVSNSQAVQATLSEYTDTDVSGDKTVIYSYNLNGKEYTIEETVTDFKVPGDMKVNIKYLPSNPSFGSIDPVKALGRKKKLASDRTGIWIGLAAMVIGGGLFFMRLRGFKTEKEQQTL